VTTRYIVYELDQKSFGLNVDWTKCPVVQNILDQMSIGRNVCGRKICWTKSRLDETSPGLENYICRWEMFTKTVHNDWCTLSFKTLESPISVSMCWSRTM